MMQVTAAATNRVAADTIMSITADSPFVASSLMRRAWPKLRASTMQYQVVVYPAKLRPYGIPLSRITPSI
jgi:hypothetical protein